MFTRREILFFLATAPAAARLALIETFQKESGGLEKKYERRTHKGDWTMPYRLFRPEAKGKLPLVMYLHGSGGLGDDNEKQLGLAAALPVCGAKSLDDGTGSPQTAVWAFHGEADKSVPVSATRDRIAARRKAGGDPRYTEYAGVDHNSWEWAYTEPELVRWTFAQKRR